MPTLASLPTATPAPTDIPVPTSTPTPTIIPPTATPNLLETQVAALQATNAAAQTTLEVLLTRSAPTHTLSASATPSLTITVTLLPSMTPVPVVPMQPQTIYVRSTANLRVCASRDCEDVWQLQAGDVITATGTIQGEVIDAGNALWFRVEYAGRELYIYSQLVSLSPPTAVPVYVPPTNPPILIFPTSAPLYVPPAASGSCPSLSANCSALTCDQAYACLAAGNGSLDRDHDGVPCESVCN
ncbi:MAG: excalibur calcium-binding domain-containing protein [Anaerolineae bacterium]|nr:excalibur calcium-binding domain-containing protein [Anaerolineae bacterium]